jgi:hypothetical protein
MGDYMEPNPYQTPPWPGKANRPNSLSRLRAWLLAMHPLVRVPVAVALIVLVALILGGAIVTAGFICDKLGLIERLEQLFTIA